MTNTFLASDHHFFHQNILKFKNNDGTPVREFSNVEEMNETMIERHNSVVQETDTVYFGGDVFFGSKSNIPNIMYRLRGKKILILGNHDEVVKQELYRYFMRIVLWHPFREHKLILSHVPLPYHQFRHEVEVNVHGHLHGEVVKNKDTWSTPDPHYFSICMERINYTPIHLDEIVKRVR
ncbi:MAG: hypothetical protein P4L79_10425 [Legionella sp.]|uniref:hypothetical protein n=1 Tax=Legionella sp. TaxID=459 RepID=UPI0028467905|nr:hypothetical protein [Legionella sp.]